MRIGRGGEGMADLWSSVLGEDAGRRGRDVRAPVVAGDAILLVGSAQQAGRSLRIVRRVARDASILRNRRVTPYIRLRRNLVLHHSMGTGGPIGNRVHCARHLPGRIVTSQTHLAVRTVAHQKILRDQILGLHVRVVTGGALNVAIDQANRPDRIPGFSLRG